MFRQRVYVAVAGDGAGLAGKDVVGMAAASEMDDAEGGGASYTATTGYTCTRS